jgi:hypothetical protein
MSASSSALLAQARAALTERASASRVRSSRMGSDAREAGRARRAASSRVALAQHWEARANERAERIRAAFAESESAYTARRAHRVTHWTLDTLRCATCRSIAERNASAQAELSAVFALPVTREDMRPGGLFERSAAQRMARYAPSIAHGNTLVTAESAADLVQRAAMLAWLDSDTVESHDWGLIPVQVPTLGAMWRGIKRAYALSLSDARAQRRLASAYANDEHIASAAAASGYGVDPVRFFDGSMSAYALRAFTEPAARWAVAPAPEDSALAERIARRAERMTRNAARDYAAERAESRVSVALGAVPPAHVTTDAADTLRADAAAVAMLAAGESVETVAETLGIKPETVARRMRSLRIRAERVAPKGRAARMVAVIRTTERSVRLGTAQSAPVAFRDLNVSRIAPESVAERRARIAGSAAERRARETQGYAAAHPAAQSPAPLPVAAGIIAPPESDASAYRVAPAQGPIVPATLAERHASAHARSACNCGQAL